MDVSRADVVVEPLIVRLKHKRAGHCVNGDRSRARTCRDWRRGLRHKGAIQKENSSRRVRAGREKAETSN